MNPNSHPRFTNVLFTSLSQFINSSSLFPTHDRRIGLTVSCGYHPEHRRVMVQVEEEQPSFISTSTGEYVEPDKVESTLRQKCSQLAATCRLQAQELLQHAERLEKLAKQNLPIIDTSKLDKDSDHRIVSSQEKTEKYRQAYSPVERVSRTVSSLDMDDI